MLLIDPDGYFGDIDYTFLMIFAGTFLARPLERAINAPYLVIVKPLKLDHTLRIDKGDLARAGPDRVFLYHLKRDELLMAVDVATSVTTTDELREAVYAVLTKTVNAKILR